MAESEMVWQVKKKTLEERLQLLVKQYAAAATDYNLATGRAEQVKHQQQMDKLEQEMVAVEAALQAHEQAVPANRAPHQRRPWRDKLPEIDYTRAWRRFEAIFHEYLDREAGAALLLLLPDCETMRANLLIRRMHVWLQERSGYTKVAYKPLEILDTNQLTSEQLLRRLGSYFNYVLPPGEEGALSPIELKRHSHSLIAKMCGSLERDQVLLLEVTVVPAEFYQTEPFLSWFLNDFWAVLLQQLAEIVRTQNRPAIKCIFAVAADHPLPPAPLLPEHYCPADNFDPAQCTKFVALPLTHWSEEEIHIWLRRHSGVAEQWAEPELKEKARTIYKRSRDGTPNRVCDQIEALLNVPNA